MSYEKVLICLAASRKPGGRCFAGKEAMQNGFGEWIRPVSDTDTEAISNQNSMYKTAQTAQLLDVIRIPMQEPRPHTFQTENHLIDSSRYWEKVGSATWQDVVAAVDNIGGALWINGFSSSNGLNDRMPVSQTMGLTTSLCLIRPKNVCLSVDRNDWTFRKQVRVAFSFNNENYKLKVTDRNVEQTYKAKGVGVYPLEDAIICVSLGDSFRGHAYKLAAAVITP